LQRCLEYRAMMADQCLPNRGRHRLRDCRQTLRARHFTWKEWAAALAEELKAAGDRGEPDDGTHYYEHWLATLERLVTAKGLSDAAALAARRRRGPMRIGTHRMGSDCAWSGQGVAQRLFAVGFAGVNFNLQSNKDNLSIKDCKTRTGRSASATKPNYLGTQLDGC